MEGVTILSGLDAAKANRPDAELDEKESAARFSQASGIAPA